MCNYVRTYVDLQVLVVPVDSRIPVIHLTLRAKDALAVRPFIYTLVVSPSHFRRQINEVFLLIIIICTRLFEVHIFVMKSVMFHLVLACCSMRMCPIIPFNYPFDLPLEFILREHYNCVIAI